MRRELALVAMVGLVVVACGDQDSDQTTTETAPATELTVQLDRGDGTPVDEWTLTCEPTGGSHPDPQAACDTLAELDPSVFEPVPPDSMCTMIHGGPQTATVTGRWNGASVDAEFSRENGCEIERWDAAADVLGEEGGVTS